MNNDKKDIEQRLSKIKEFYLAASDMFDSIPESALPTNIKNQLKGAILGDKELKQLIDNLDKHRPPKLFLVGRTGVGKSSLINALCGAYVAEVGDVKSCTQGAKVYECKDQDRVLMEILDSRGIAESESLDKAISAEDELIVEINTFSPDAVIFMLNCTHRDDIIEDVNFLKKVAKSYYAVNKSHLPIVAVVNKCDEMSPSRHKIPQSYPQKKIDKIEETVQYYKDIIVKNGLKIDDIIGVSSLIDWQMPNGDEVDPDDIMSLPRNDVEHLEIAFDGRYKIEELLDILENAILELDARMGLRMAARLQTVVDRLANHLIKLFSGIAGTIALTPIPVSDIYILILLQSVLVAFIAFLSGKESSINSALEFIMNLGRVSVAGYIFKVIAQQGSKLLNVFWPGAGSAVSAAVAMTGTAMIGKSAISYYLHDESMENAREILLQHN